MRWIALCLLMLVLASAPRVADAADLSRLTEPDGTYFVDDGSGGVRFVSSGFVCPKTAGAFERADLLLVDTAQGGRDLGCRLFTADHRSWLSVFVTRYDDRRTARDQFESYLSEAQYTTPPAARDSNLPPPLLPGTPPAPSHGQFWKDRQGQGQGLWLTRVGHWYIELRTTYALDSSEVTGAAAAQLFEAVYGGVHDSLAQREGGAHSAPSAP